MNEAETRAELIDPALHDAGWGVVAGSRVRREVITLGRLQGAGKRSQQDIADYVLMYRGHKLAVIEAKRRDLPDTQGLGQAKKYAEKLQCRFAFSTNGVGIYRADMETGAEGYFYAYPTPHELWDETFAEDNEWRNRFAAVPFEDAGGAWDESNWSGKSSTWCRPPSGVRMGNPCRPRNSLSGFSVSCRPCSRMKTSFAGSGAAPIRGASYSKGLPSAVMGTSSSRKWGA